jgi:hypothetical protein
MLSRTVGVWEIPAIVILAERQQTRTGGYESYNWGYVRLRKGSQIRWAGDRSAALGVRGLSEGALRTSCGKQPGWIWTYDFERFEPWPVGPSTRTQYSVAESHLRQVDPASRDQGPGECRLQLKRLTVKKGVPRPPTVGINGDSLAVIDMFAAGQKIRLGLSY